MDSLPPPAPTHITSLHVKEVSRDHKGSREEQEGLGEGEGNEDTEERNLQEATGNKVHREDLHVGALKPELLWRGWGGGTFASNNKVRVILLPPKLLEKMSTKATCGAPLGLGPLKLKLHYFHGGSTPDGNEESSALIGILAIEGASAYGKEKMLKKGLPSPGAAEYYARERKATCISILTFGV